MHLRGLHFPSVVAIRETLTLEGDAAPRARASLFFGAGVMVSDGRACRQGLSAYLASGSAARETEPFFLAFRPTGDTAELRMEKTRDAVSCFIDALGGISVTVAIVLDLSLLCTGDAAAFLSEARGLLAECGGLGVPVVPAVSVLCPPETASAILMDPNADALYLAESMAWDDMPERARKVFFRTTVSPLARVGGGRISGKYLLPLSVEWVRQLKRSLAMKPVIAGGGLLRPKDVDALKEAGASAVTLLAARKLRPWNVWRIARRARAVFAK